MVQNLDTFCIFFLFTVTKTVYILKISINNECLRKCKKTMITILELIKPVSWLTPSLRFPSFKIIHGKAAFSSISHSCRPGEGSFSLWPAALQLCPESQTAIWIFSSESALCTVSSLRSQILIPVALGLHKLDCLNSGDFF